MAGHKQKENSMKVKVDYPNKPKGATIDIPGLGSFKNGSTSEVEDSAWERFLNRHESARKALGDNKSQATIPFDIPPLVKSEDEAEDETTTTTSDTSDKAADATTKSDKE